MDIKLLEENSAVMVYIRKLFPRDGNQEKELYLCTGLVSIDTLSEKIIKPCKQHALNNGLVFCSILSLGSIDENGFRYIKYSARIK